MADDRSRIVRVALPVPVAQLFDYKAIDASDRDVGRCVRVPFGRSQKSGVIVALPPAAGVDEARLKAVVHIQREVPALPADWLELVGFVARYYHAPIGEVIALALPPGLRRADAVCADDADPFIAPTAAGSAALASARRSSRALALVRALRELGPQRRSAARALPDGAALSDALRRGWLAVTAAPVLADAGAQRPAPTAEQ